MRKEVRIDFEEGEGTEKVELHGVVTLKRLNFSERNQLEEEATEIKVTGNVPTVRVSVARMKELGLFRSIVDSKLDRVTYYEDKQTKKPAPQTQPYLLDLNGIKNLPQEVGESLFVEFTSLNEVSQKKNVK